ncbi:MAG: aminotransferase class I/II-fold pyridoxal phosphate-dependent enzyme [Christensenellaceae bacterium]
MTLHIYEMLRSHKRHISFHTPGHKRGKWDLTELSFSDNLANPTGVIRLAEDDVTAILGSARSFLLTDGSTSGVLSMLYASGVKRLFLPEASHKSAYNGCKLMGIATVHWKGERERGLPPLVTAEAIRSKAEEVDGVFLTSPDYYGRIPDLAAIRAVCDEKGLTLLIDGAHGGHLHGEGGYAGTVADYWVDGVHKSLPALTQGAIVSARSEEGARRLKEAVGIFRTTSPSYPIMASVEYAVKCPPNERVRSMARALAARYGMINDDWTKLVVPFGSAADEAEKYLEAHGIYAEYNDGNYLVFYISDKNTVRELQKLDRTLKKLRVGQLAFGKRRTGERRGSIVLLPVEEAVGHTAARPFGLFPPCIPLVAEGEIVEESDARLMRRAKHTFGTEEDKVYVYEG